MFPKSARSSAARREPALAGAFAALLCGWAGHAAAGTPSCTVSASGVAFGAYDAGGDTDAAGYIDVFCTCVTGNDCTDLPYTLEIQAGASGSTNVRLMERSGGTETLAYGLYQDSSHTTNWGIGGDAVGRTYGVALFGGSQRTQVYGLIPQGQHVRPGIYGETPAIVLLY